MTLLSDLIDSASGDTVSVSTLLRKVKVIAARTKTGDLEEWVEHELVGYPDTSSLPEYRGPFSTEVKGHFSGPFQSGIKNAPIAPIGFPADWRGGALFNVIFHQPIAELEQLAKSKKPLEAPWTADAIAFTNTLIARGEVHTYEGMRLQQAWRVISPAQLQAIVDTVRSRILDLALGFEAVDPDVGQANATPDREKVQQVVTNVFGGSANIAISSSQFEQSITLPAPGDVDSLVQYLKELGLSASALTDLREALHGDRNSGEDEQGKAIGPRVSQWLGRLMIGAGKTVTSTVVALTTTAISAHYGLK
jgi:hypothetical protein